MKFSVKVTYRDNQGRLKSCQDNADTEREADEAQLGLYSFVEDIGAHVVDAKLCRMRERRIAA